MKLKTHRYIAGTAISLIEDITGQRFNHRLVKLGACMPDIALNRRIKLHTPELAGIQYNKMLKKFEDTNRSNAFLSYMLGLYSHYVADAFCLAHNYYVADFKKHVQYEALLQKNMYDTTLPIDVVDVIVDKLKDLKDETTLGYIEKENTNYKNLISTMSNWEEIAEIDLNLAVIHSVTLMIQFLYEAQAKPVLVPAV